MDAPLVVHTDRGRAHLAVGIAGRGHATACGRLLVGATAWRWSAPLQWMRLPRCGSCERRADAAPDWPALVRAARW